MNETRAYVVNVKSTRIVRGQMEVNARNAKDAARLACEIADAEEWSLSNPDTESGRFTAFEVYRAEPKGYRKA